MEQQRPLSLHKTWHCEFFRQTGASIPAERCFTRAAADFQCQKSSKYKALDALFYVYLGREGNSLWTLTVAPVVSCMLRTLSPFRPMRHPTISGSVLSWTLAPEIPGCL